MGVCTCATFVEIYAYIKSCVSWGWRGVLINSRINKIKIYKQQQQFGNQPSWSGIFMGVDHVNCWKTVGVNYQFFWLTIWVCVMLGFVWAIGEGPFMNMVYLWWCRCSSSPSYDSNDGVDVEGMSEVVVPRARWGRWVPTVYVCR